MQTHTVTINSCLQHGQTITKNRTRFQVSGAGLASVNHPRLRSDVTCMVSAARDIHSPLLPSTVLARKATTLPFSTQTTEAPHIHQQQPRSGQGEDPPAPLSISRGRRGKPQWILWQLRSRREPSILLFSIYFLLKGSLNSHYNHKSTG